MNAHATLGVPPTATLPEAKRAYRRQLRALHPDTGTGDTGALAAVRSAYRELERTLRIEAVRTAPSPRVDVYA